MDLPGGRLCNRCFDAKKEYKDPPGTDVTSKKKTKPVVLEVEAEGLPRGWIKKGIVRMGGLTKGNVDTYWFSPSGQKFRSVKEVTKHMKLTKDPGYDPTAVVAFMRIVNI